MDSQATRMSGVKARGLGLFLLFVTGIWAVIALYVAHDALPFNPVRLPFGAQVMATTWAPEGWAFFTRDPREPRILLFGKTKQAWRSTALTPHSRPSNAFGLDRRSRSQGVEYALLLHQVPDSAWTRCHAEPSVCLESLPTAITLTNELPRESLCGEVGFLSREPIPWAWARSGKTISMPARAVRIHVRC